MRYDVQAIKDAVDIVVVAEEIGLDILTSGTRKLILCPFHDDHNYGSCFLTEHGFKCYSCGACGDVFSLVEGVLGISFMDAVRVVANICGGEEYFQADAQDAVDVVTGLIPPADMKLIGLHNEPVSVVREVVDSQDEVEESQKIEPEYAADDFVFGYGVVERVVSNPLRELYLSDRASYHELISQHCEATINQRKTELELFRSHDIQDPSLKKLVETTRTVCGLNMIETYYGKLIGDIRRIDIMYGLSTRHRKGSVLASASVSAPLNSDLLSSIQNRIWENENVPF